MLQSMKTVNVLNSPIQKIVYNYPNKIMVSCWGTYSYFNNEDIQNCHIEIMTDAYGLSGLFRSRVRSNYIVHNTYTGRSSRSRSTSTKVHGPVHNYDLNYSYLRSHFSRLP